MSLLVRERGPPPSVALHVLMLCWVAQALTDSPTHAHTHPATPPPPLLHHTSTRNSNLAKLTTTPHIIPHHHTPHQHHHTITPPHHQNKQNMSETVEPQLVGKYITFEVVGQITHMNHQNNQEEKYHLLCDG